MLFDKLIRIGVFKLFLSFWTIICNAQSQSDTLTVEQIIESYRISGRNLSIINSRYAIDSIRFINNLNSFKVKSSVGLSIPYIKAIESIVQPDGSNRLIERNFLSPTLDLNMSKKIKATGGEVSLSYSLNNFTDYVSKNKQFSMNWINFRYSQNLLGFNENKFEFKITKAKQEEASIAVLIQREREILSFLRNLFKLHINQVKENQILANIKKTEYLLDKNKKLVQFGQALPQDTIFYSNTLFKLKISLMKLKEDYTIDFSELQYSLNRDVNFNLRTEITPPILVLDSSLLYNRYIQFTKNIDHLSNKLEIDSELEKAKRNRGIDISLDIGAGVNSKGDDYVYELFQNKPSNRQNISVGLRVPITGWSEYRNKKVIAEANYQNYLKKEEDEIFDAKIWVLNIMSRYKQAKTLWELSVNNIIQLSELENIIIKDISLGKSDLTKLNQLFLDKETATEAKCNAVRDIYLIKQECIVKTLYDTEYNTPIE